jgi:hypothetical protein
MDKREKVIYSIERCICHVPDACRDCAYDAGHPYNECVEMLLRDALELLKAQEPKLLTIEEITGDGECWFEGINGACGYADCYMCTVSKEVEVNRISMKPEYVSWDDFKKKWRCWTSRPTDEQREATQWAK